MNKEEIRNALLKTAVSFDTDKERIYWEEVKRQRKEIERLRKDLKEYGCHLHTCPRYNHPGVSCDCGFIQALKTTLDLTDPPVGGSGVPRQYEDVEKEVDRLLQKRILEMELMTKRKS